VKKFREGTLSREIIVSDNLDYCWIECSRIGEWISGICVARKCTSSQVLHSQVQLLLVTLVSYVCVRVCVCYVSTGYTGHIKCVVALLGYCRLYVASLVVYRSLHHERKRERERGTMGEQRALYLSCAQLYLLFKRISTILVMVGCHSFRGQCNCQTLATRRIEIFIQRENYGMVRFRKISMNIDRRCRYRENLTLLPWELRNRSVKRNEEIPMGDNAIG